MLLRTFCSFGGAHAYTIGIYIALIIMCVKLFKAKRISGQKKEKEEKGRQRKRNRS